MYFEFRDYVKWCLKHLFDFLNKVKVLSYNLIDETRKIYNYVAHWSRFFINKCGFSFKRQKKNFFFTKIDRSPILRVFDIQTTFRTLTNDT